MNKKYFFQHPYELENDARMKLLDKRMPDSGPGVFWKIFYRLRLGNGTYPLSAIISEIAGENKVRRRRVERVLNEFNLFIIENKMVTLANGLTISDIHPRNERKPSTQEKLEKIQQNISEGYDNTLMPDELRQMDETALKKVQSEIREANADQLASINHKP